ncbi:MAG: iron chaperone [Cyclobacteriaceae bacterium]
MQYQANTPDEYLSELEDDWRKEKLAAVRKMITSSGPELVEGIEYKMLSYGDSKTSIFHLNAQRAYVSLYVGNIDKVENARELLKDIEMGKGCIRIKKNQELEKTNLNEFIAWVIALWREGKDTDC